MDEREQIITIVFSVLGFLAMVIIIACSVRFYRRRNRSSSTRQRQRYQRSQKLTTANAIQKKQKRRKPRLNTNDSAISFSFNPPHLINQNVKNLDQLIPPEQFSAMEIDRCYVNPSTEPVYTSASSLSNVALALQMYPHTQHLNNLHFQFLNELNHALCLKHEQRPSNISPYSPNSRQQNNLSPLDYYRSITPSSAAGSNQHLVEPKPRPTVVTHKLPQIRDDTAILY